MTSERESALLEVDLPTRLLGCGNTLKGGPFSRHERSLVEIPWLEERAGLARK